MSSDQVTLVVCCIYRGYILPIYTNNNHYRDQSINQPEPVMMHHLLSCWSTVPGCAFWYHHRGREEDRRQVVLFFFCFHIPIGSRYARCPKKGIIYIYLQSYDREGWDLGFGFLGHGGITISQPSSWGIQLLVFKGVGSGDPYNKP